MRWRILIAGALVAGSVVVSAEAGRAQQIGAGSSPGGTGGPGGAALPQAPADLLLPPHLTGAFPHTAILGQERALPTLQDVVRVIPSHPMPTPSAGR